MKNSGLVIAFGALLIAAIVQNVLLFTLSRRVTTLEARVSAMQSRAARFSIVPGMMRPPPGMGPGLAASPLPSGTAAATDTPHAVLDEAAAAIMARLIQLDDSPGLGLSADKKTALRKRMAKSWPPDTDLVKARAQAAAIRQAFDGMLDDGQKQVLARLDFVVDNTAQALRNRAVAQGTNVFTMLTSYLEGVTPAP